MWHLQFHTTNTYESKDSNPALFGSIPISHYYSGPGGKSHFCSFSPYVFQRIPTDRCMAETIRNSLVRKDHQILPQLYISSMALGETTWLRTLFLPCLQIRSHHGYCGFVDIEVGSCDFRKLYMLGWSTYAKIGITLCSSSKGKADQLYWMGFRKGGIQGLRDPTWLQPSRLFFIPTSVKGPFQNPSEVLGVLSSAHRLSINIY